MTRRPALLLAAALSAAGLVLALLLAREHAQAHAGLTSFCAINAYVNCDRVATSPYAVVLGLPVAVWGILGYGVALVLSLAGLSPRRDRESWPAGLLFLAALAFSAVAVTLAIVSEVLIGALCLLCAGSWVASLLLLGAAWRACRPQGVLAAVRSDLALLRARPGRALGVAVAAAASILILVAAYPRYWAKGAPPAVKPAGAPVDPGAAAAAGGSPGATPGASQGPIVVVAFSDYECPFCAIAHVQARQVLAGRPDVRLVRRQFPLDSECNPLLKRRMHQEACGLAKAALCAEDQGKGDAMDDALFANQKARLPLDAVAEGVGLDLARLHACMASPEAAARLAADVEAGIRVGLKATPTYVINGRRYDTGSLAEILPPPAAARN